MCLSLHLKEPTPVAAPLMPVYRAVETAMYPMLRPRPGSKRAGGALDRDERVAERSMRVQWAEENRAAVAANQAADQAADEEEQAAQATADLVEEAQARGRARMAQETMSYSTLHAAHEKLKADGDWVTRSERKEWEDMEKANFELRELGKVYLKKNAENVEKYDGLWMRHELLRDLRVVDKSLVKQLQGECEYLRDICSTEACPIHLLEDAEKKLRVQTDRLVIVETRYVNQINMLRNAHEGGGALAPAIAELRASTQRSVESRQRVEDMNDQLIDSYRITNEMENEKDKEIATLKRAAAESAGKLELSEAKLATAEQKLAGVKLAIADQVDLSDEPLAP